MGVQNRISVSFNDREFRMLDRLSAHTQKSKAELIRTIVEEFLQENQNRFRRTTSLMVQRQTNIVLPDTTMERGERDLDSRRPEEMTMSITALAQSMQTEDRAQAERCRQALAKRKRLTETFSTNAGPVTLTGEVQSVVDHVDANPRFWKVTFKNVIPSR